MLILRALSGFLISYLISLISYLILQISLATLRNIIP